MILITGASGHVGGRIAELLANQGPELRLMVRNIKKAPRLPGTEIVQADYAEPQTLQKAFMGVDSAFIVSGYAIPGERAKLHNNAIDAADRAGVSHIVYLSFQGASAGSKFPMGRDHFQTEQHLKATGIAFTILRDNLYLDLLPEMFNENGILRGPAKDGSVAWVTREDVARVAVAVLKNPVNMQRTYDVTGPESLTMAETVKRLSKMVGRSLKYDNESVEEGRNWRSQLGPDWQVDTWLGSYLAIADGELEQASDTVLKITGNKPFDMETYFHENTHLLDPLREH